jgi:hypothetical protein
MTGIVVLVDPVILVVGCDDIDDVTNVAVLFDMGVVGDGICDGIDVMSFWLYTDSLIEFAQSCSIFDSLSAMSWFERYSIVHVLVV